MGISNAKRLGTAAVAVVSCLALSGFGDGAKSQAAGAASFNVP